MSFSLFSNLSSLRKMAPSILSLKRAISSPRYFSTRYPVEELTSHLHTFNHLFTCLVSLSTRYSGCSEPFTRQGTGVVLAPKLVVTSTYVVADVSTSQKNGGSVTHTAYIGTTAAMNIQGKTLMTKPLAVNFENDVAVLQLVDPEGIMLSHCEMASSPPEKENILVAIANDDGEVGYTGYQGNVRGVGEKTVRVVAPWPRDDDLGWIEHDWNFYGGAGVPPDCNLATSREKVSGSVSKITGSPWLNVDGEVVGIASWELMDEEANFGLGYAAPTTSIRSVLEYAKTRRAWDPIVMDSWIK